MKVKLLNDSFWPLNFRWDNYHACIKMTSCHATAEGKHRDDTLEQPGRCFLWGGGGGGKIIMNINDDFSGSREGGRGGKYDPTPPAPLQLMK